MKKLFLFVLLSVVECNAFAIEPHNEAGVINSLSKTTFLAETQWPERYHDNIRTLRYPRAEHELFFNPCPLILPQSAKADSVQFALSISSSFPNDANTITSKFVSWAIFTPHQSLAPGIWYWKYRTKNKSGVVLPWSTINSFTVKSTTPVFVTPPLEQMIGGIPSGYPRLFKYLQSAWEQGRSTISNDPEYRDLLGRTNGAMTTDYTTVLPISTRLSQINNAVIYFLFPAYVLTGDVKFKNRLVELVRHVLTLPDPTQADNGIYKQFMTLTYDQCYNDFTDAERLHIEEILVKLLELEKGGRWYLECHVYENHGLQYDIVDKFRTAVVLYGKYPIAREYLEYCYDTWTGRAPMGGFVRDGGDFNGVGYFGIDGLSIHYMSGILSSYTGVDFYAHPWCQKLGQVALYSFTPNSSTLGFGDGHSAKAPASGWVAFVDLMARQNRDPYGQWYVNMCANAKNDYSLRMYRMGLNKLKPVNSTVTLPDSRPKALWLPDCGEAYIHSDIANTNSDLGLSLRASTYGSGSHCIADNNSFIMTYKGQMVYQNTGYYDAGVMHNLLSSRHTQAHNSILVDGIGQPMSTLDYANLARVLDGKNISYALGDASHAYARLTDYTQWTSLMASVNITQTPEFGFGETSLSRFRRHVLMLHPNKVLIYDDLEAGTPVRWDWLLHSAKEFSIEEKNKRIVLEKNMNPLSSLESGSISDGCGILSFDYVQSESDNVNLEVYVNDKLVSTKVTSNEKGILKSSGNIIVNMTGIVKLKFKQKDALSGQVGINNLKWTSFSSGFNTDFFTGHNEVAGKLNFCVNGGLGWVDIKTNRAGLINITTLLGLSIVSQSISEKGGRILLSPGLYLTTFVSSGVKSETIKVVVK